MVYTSSRSTRDVYNMDSHMKYQLYFHRDRLVDPNNDRV